MMFLAGVVRGLRLPRAIQSREFWALWGIYIGEHEILCRVPIGNKHGRCRSEEVRDLRGVWCRAASGTILELVHR